MKYSKESKKRLFKNKSSLSDNAKLDGVKSFDLPLTTCQNRCMLSNKFFKICYAENNQNQRRPNRVKKLLHNLQLIRSSKFVKVFSYEVRNFNKIRFFSSGDIEDGEQLRKIIQVAKIRHDTKFTLITSRDDLLLQAVQTKQTKPDNLQIILSSGLIDEPVPQFEKDILSPFGVQFSHITTDKKTATCEASKTGFCGDCSDCYQKPADQTSTSKKDGFIFSLHGNNNTRKIKKYGNKTRAEIMKEYQQGNGSALQTVQNHAKTQNQTKTHTKTRTTARTARKAQNQTKPRR